jgi:stage V sporulation protein R
MELISQHTKRIMEGCKERAAAAGLRFQPETLEYIVTNRDLLELTPKLMIPTLYDYWVHDVEVLREKGRYELYPSNPYETVINTRPTISYYNDNNPDWMNVMIFYHVIAHMDFFQNNLFFRHTWDYDFTGQALSDKRMIAQLRSEKGRWVDYVIEFARGIDNLVGFHAELARLHAPSGNGRNRRLDYYFDVFLQSVRQVNPTAFLKEVDRYNECLRVSEFYGERTFFAEVMRQYPEFEALFRKHREAKPATRQDLLEFLLQHSEFLAREQNEWMKAVIEVVRQTSVFFQPQIRTKIMNEGWASLWHERLFLQDSRIRGHEVDFARAHAGVTSLPRVGLNPYALGMRLFEDIQDLAEKGRRSLEFRRLTDATARERYDTRAGNGSSFIFEVRENLNDFLFINTFVDQDFVDRHRLFVAGRRLNQARKAWEIYVRSRSAEDYRAMLLEQLYHPPCIRIEADKTQNGSLYLVHRFEGKPLIREFIANTLLGIEFLWGKPVQLETSEVIRSDAEPVPLGAGEELPAREIAWERVLYTMKERKLERDVLR